MLVSVHLPKTAGTSFRATLRDTFAEKLYEDYSDFPINTDDFSRNSSALKYSLLNIENTYNNIECIHGHFLPLKYLLLSNRRKVDFITWMRHPVDRVISHYYFWLRTYDSKKSPPLHKKIVEEEWSLEQFCFSNEIRNIYNKFLWAFPMDYFSFIGITEMYERDLECLTKTFFNNNNIVPLKLNASTEKYEISNSMKKRIEEYHSLDMDIYRRALVLSTLR